MAETDRQEIAGLRLAKAAELAVSNGENVSISVLGHPSPISCESVKGGVIVTEVVSGGHRYVISTPAITTVKIG